MVRTTKARLPRIRVRSSFDTTGLLSMRFKKDRGGDLSAGCLCVNSSIDNRYEKRKFEGFRVCWVFSLSDESLGGAYKNFFQVTAFFAELNDRKALSC